MKSMEYGEKKLRRKILSVDGNIYKKLMELKRESLCVHTKKEDNIKNQYGAIATPIFQTATFAHPGIGMST